MTHVLGIDAGTESLRAFVFDLEGKVLADQAVAYPTRFPAPAWAEQDPEDWWRALGEAVKAAVAEAAIAPDSVGGLSLDTTCCSVVALDEAGRPLRPALIWMDVRAAEEAAMVAATGDPALRVNGGGEGPVSAEWMLPKALWLKRNEPESWAKAVRIGEFQDYLNLRLTGEWVGSLNNMSVRWHYQSRHGGRPATLLRTLDLEALEERWPDRVIAPGDPVGGLTREAADHLGLPAGTPVIQGGADAFIAMIGLGVSQPGEMALVTGSSHLHLGIASKPLHKAGVWGTYMDAVYPDKPVIEGGQTSTGSIINWFKRHFAPDTPYETLNAAAAALPPGAEGLLVLDHFQGNRTPYTDPHSRGAIIGLTLKHEPAHVFRAIIEGICFGTRLIVETFGEALEPDRIVVAGGATRSPLWLQIHADTLGAPLTLTANPAAPALGCGILAAKATGAYGSIEEAARAMVETTEVIEPDRERSAHYRAIFERYRDLYAALSPFRPI